MYHEWCNHKYRPVRPCPWALYLCWLYTLAAQGAIGDPHQKIARNLTGELYNYFKGKTCQLFSAPFDVVLGNKEGLEDSVVQPDLCVVCDPKKLENDKRCLGAPDLIIEILSPGNSQKELRYKYELYQESGVCEYWVVRPTDKEITQFVLENGQYRTLPPIVEGDVIHSVIFPELGVATEDIFRL